MSSSLASRVCDCCGLLQALCSQAAADVLQSIDFSASVSKRVEALVAKAAEGLVSQGPPGPASPQDKQKLIETWRPINSRALEICTRQPTKQCLQLVRHLLQELPYSWFPLLCTIQNNFCSNMAFVQSLSHHELTELLLPVVEGSPGLKALVSLLVTYKQQLENGTTSQPEQQQDVTGARVAIQQAHRHRLQRNDRRP